MRTQSRSGFTLIELLLVIAIMAILGTIILGGANYVTKVARVKRANTTATALEVALSRYRAEYNEWPKGGLPIQTKYPNDPEKKYRYVEATGSENEAIFAMLRADNANDNENGIHFLDETSLFTTEDEGGETVLVPYADKGGGPICFLSRAGRIRYFKVFINLDADTASVSCPNLDDD